MLKCAAVGAELDVFRESVQLARPSDPASQVFLSISIPGSLDEWRAARRELEGRLFAAGFKDSETRGLLPDGGRDDRGRRVAARRNRGRAGKAEPAAKVSAKSAS
jgi:hypothetical protein